MLCGSTCVNCSTVSEGALLRMCTVFSRLPFREQEVGNIDGMILTAIGVLRGRGWGLPAKLQLCQLACCGRSVTNCQSHGTVLKADV
jgi:hypothetical protein